jgi:hypothetical protein
VPNREAWQDVAGWGWKVGRSLSISHFHMEHTGKWWRIMINPWI